MRKSLLWLLNGAIALGTIVFLLFYVTSTVPRSSTLAQNLNLPGAALAPPAPITHLAFLMYPTSPGGEVVISPEDSPVSLMAYPVGPGGPDGQPETLFTYPLRSDCDIDRLIPSPNASYLLLEFNCHANSFVQLWSLTDLSTPSLSLERGYFLDWSPDSSWILFRDVDANQVSLIAVDGTTQIVLEKLPFGTYNAVFASDGQQILYAASYGLGFGSEMGALHLADNTLVVHKEFSDQTVALPRWSPDSNKLAYILLADNNVPFTVGELWLANMSDGTDVLLEEVDAGHGYPPVWTPNGQALVYVYRENPGSLQADYLATALHSNLYQISANTYEVTALTQFTNTLVYDAVWAPDGSQLAFTAGDAVWLLEPGQAPSQLTDTGIARHPAWIALPHSAP